MLEVSCIISAAAGDWPDFFVILAMVLVNAALGFREEMKPKNALAELTNQMESSIPCARTGEGGVGRFPKMGDAPKRMKMDGLEREIPLK